MSKIAELKAMDDAAILSKFGFDKKVEKFKQDLARADALPEGKEKERIERELERAFQPSSYVIEDIGWQVDRAEKDLAKGDAKLEQECTDFVNDCGCVDHID